MNAYTMDPRVEDTAAGAPPEPAAPVPREVELKLFVPAASIDHLWANPWLIAQAIGPLRVARLDNRYFDTPDRALAQRRMALRLRRSGRQWLQTLKVADADEGALSSRGEWEMPVAGPVLELRRLRDTPLSTIVPQRGLAARLAPVFTTSFRRESRLLRLKDGSVVEFAFDRGLIVSGRGRSRRTLPICEVEIEAKEGTPDLMKFAARLVRDVALVPLAASKAARGHRLAEGRALEPARADLPVPRGDDDVRMHLARVLGACNRALLANAHALLETVAGADAGIEFVHQARVAVRRMRSALRTFGSVVEPRRLDALDAELTALGTMLGGVRDWDVFATTTMKRLRDEVASDDEGKVALEAIRVATAAQRDDAHRRLIAALATGAFGATTIAVERMATRLTGKGGRRTTLAESAPDWLANQRERLIRLARRIAVLDNDARHGLRVEVKRLRYALDLLEGLYEPKAVAAFHDALADLQDRLGRLNDLVVAKHLLHALPESEASALARTRFDAWLHHHVRKQLPKVAAQSVAFELTPVPWLATPASSTVADPA